LVLRHDSGKPTAFTSIKQPISQISKNNEPTHFFVDWSVSPNALKGPAELALVGQAGDGSEIPLLAASKPWIVNVNLGGEIDVSQKSYSGNLNEDLVSFFVEFELSCKQKNLKGAQLRAAVLDSDRNQIDEVPVAVGSNGQYQVSWNIENKFAKNGKYIIDVYRQVDKRRSNQAEAFLSIIHNHVPSSSTLPIRTEFLILLIFVGSFVWASYKKMEIQGIRK